MGEIKTISKNNFENITKNFINILNLCELNESNSLIVKYLEYKIQEIIVNDIKSAKHSKKIVKDIISCCSNELNLQIENKNLERELLNLISKLIEQEDISQYYFYEKFSSSIGYVCSFSFLFILLTMVLKNFIPIKKEYTSNLFITIIILGGIFGLTNLVLRYFSIKQFKIIKRILLNHPITSDIVFILYFYLMKDKVSKIIIEKIYKDILSKDLEYRYLFVENSIWIGLPPDFIKKFFKAIFYGSINDPKKASTCLAHIIIYSPFEIIDKEIVVEIISEAFHEFIKEIKQYIKFTSYKGNKKAVDNVTYFEIEEKIANNITVFLLNFYSILKNCEILPNSLKNELEKMFLNSFNWNLNEGNPIINLRKGSAGAGI